MVDINKSMQHKEVFTRPEIIDQTKELAICQIGAVNGWKALAFHLTSLRQFYFSYCC